MLVEEWRGVRWKILAGAMGAIPAAMIVAWYLPPYEAAWRATERFTGQVALGQILNVYEGGGVALALLAVLLGAATVSEETGRSTILLLLARPVSRGRIFLTKYLVSAAVLLAAAVVGHAGLICAAVLRGYPLGLLSGYGVILSTVLIWLGVLSVLGLAALFSVAFRNPLVSAALAFVAACLFIYVVPSLAGAFVPSGVLERIAPSYSWTSASLYAGEGLAPLNFLACAASAMMLTIAPLWMFRRKAF